MNNSAVDWRQIRCMQPSQCSVQLYYTWGMQLMCVHLQMGDCPSAVYQPGGQYIRPFCLLCSNRASSTLPCAASLTYTQACKAL
jgi:hypothetical protein